MKRRKALRWIAPALAGLGAIGMISLASAGPGKGGADRGARKAEMLQKYDANGDGSLDDTERQAMREDRMAARQARKAEMLAKYDTDGDGTLSETERAAIHAEMVATRFAKLDTNGDGVLSFEEFEAGAKLNGKRFGKHKRFGHGKRGGHGKRFGGKHKVAE